MFFIKSKEFLLIIEKGELLIATFSVYMVQFM